MVECFPSIHEGLGSIPSTMKKREKRRKRGSERLRNLLKSQDWKMVEQGTELGVTPHHTQHCLSLCPGLLFLRCSSHAGVLQNHGDVGEEAI